MAHLAVLQPDPRAEARLCDALGGKHELVLAHSWSGLERLLAGEPLDGCIVDADFPGREEAVAEIRKIRQAYGSIAIVAHADAALADAELIRFGRIGVDGIVLARASFRYGKYAGIRQAVDRALALARAERVRSALDGRYGTLCSDAVAWAVEHAAEAPDVASFAAAMGRSRRALGAALHAEGLPVASRVLVWGRLLLAGAFLARDHRTVEEAAYALRYSSANALGRAMKRETGFTPSEVAARGGLVFLQSVLFPRTRPRRRRRSGGRKALAVTLALSLHASHAATAQSVPAPAARGRGLAEAIDGILDAPPFDQMHFGIRAVDAASGDTLYERNSRRKFVPASNQKLLVVSTALSLLGPEYRYRTGLWAAGMREDSVLNGDLVLAATGDPTLSRTFWSSGEEALAALADSVAATGIRHVTGALVVDASTWDSASVGPLWEAADLSEAYGASGGPFAIEDGELHIRAVGAPEAGGPPVVTWHPTAEPDFVVSRVVTAPADSVMRIHASWLPETHRLMLEGWVGAGQSDTTSIAARDPVRQATAGLYRALLAHGVEIDGGWSVAWDPGEPVGVGCLAGQVTSCATSTPVAALDSPSLDAIAAATLAPSQNWITDQLLRTLGVIYRGRGSWRDGVDVVKWFLQDSVGVDSLDLAMYDGSGLSPADLVTPRALVRILRYMAGRPGGDGFRGVMARPSQKGSTLEQRLPALASRLFAKTGTITNVNALSGYLVGDDGREVVFSILSNGSGLPSTRAREAIDDVVRVLAGRYP